MSRPPIYTVILPILLLLGFAGCSRGTDSRLLRIAEQTESDPRAAIKALKEIEPEELNEADRNYRDLLLIKANDKAYITHTSDSAVKSLMEYYHTDRETDSRYAETMYYAGRTYSDMGDAPMALRCFHDALKWLPEDDMHLQLRANICAQTARILDRMRMDSEAAGYMKTAINVDKALKDTVNLAYDLQLLGQIYTRMDSLDKAESNFVQVEAMTHLLPQQISDINRMCLATIENLKGNTRKALSLIRPLPAKADSLTLKSVMAHAAQIYADAGLTDTAGAYARWLINSKGDDDKKTGYRLLLSEKLRNTIPADSMEDCLEEYHRLLEKYYDENSARRVISQNNVYNYDLQVKERNAAKESRDRFLIWALVSTVLLLMTLTIALWWRRRVEKRLLLMHETLATLNSIKTETPDQSDETLSETDASTEEDTDDSPETVNAEKPDIENKEIKRRKRTEKMTAEKLREEIREMVSQMTAESKNTEVPEVIRKSRVYERLKEIAAKGTGLTPDDTLWEDLNRVITRASRHFNKRLEVLIGEKPTTDELRLAELAKCGLTNKEIGILTSVNDKTIWNRKAAFVKRLYGMEADGQTAGYIIMLL